MRYLVFAGQYYYPSGGWDDYRAQFDNLDEARSYAKSLIKFEQSYLGGWINVGEDWWQIISLESLTVVEHGDFHDEKKAKAHA